MAQKPSNETHRRPTPDPESTKQPSNGFINPDNSRSFTKSSSDTFGTRSTMSVPSEKNRSATYEDFPSFSDAEFPPPPSDLDEPPEGEARLAILRTDVTNENEDWSEESHTLGGSSDSAKTVKTEICLRPARTEARKAVHSWPQGVPSFKSSLSSSKLPSLNSFENSSAKKKRVRMKEDETGDKHAQSRSSSVSKEKPTSSKGKMTSSKDKPTSSKEKGVTSEGASRGGGRVKERDVALKLPPATVQIPADKQIMPKSPSSGLTTPSEKASDVTSPIQEAKKFLKGGTRAILIQDGVLAHWQSIPATPHQSAPSQEGDSPIDASKPTHDPYSPVRS